AAAFPLDLGELERFVREAPHQIVGSHLASTKFCSRVANRLETRCGCGQLRRTHRRWGESRPLLVEERSQAGHMTMADILEKASGGYEVLEGVVHISSLE